MSRPKEKPASEPFPDTIAGGQNYFAYDLRDGERSLWRRSKNRTTDYMLVSWAGWVTTPPETSHLYWDWERYSVELLTPDDASLIIMGARHLTTRDSWQAFAQRFADRIRNRDPSCQMI